MKLNIFLLFLSALALTACNDDDNPTTTATTGGTSPVQTQNAFETLNNALTSLTAKFPTTTCNTTTGAQGDFDTKIEMQSNTTTFNTTGTSDTTLYLKTGSDLSAAKTVQATSVSETVVKRSTGETFYENRDYTNSKHISMYVKGTLDTNGSIATLNNMQMIQATGKTGSEGGSVLYATDGTNTWQDQYVGTARSQGFDTCTTSTTGATANCTALTIAYDSQFHDFTTNPVSNYNNGTMMTTTAPINMSF